MAARARNAEVVLPIVMGTIAFYLGKKVGRGGPLGLLLCAPEL